MKMKFKVGLLLMLSVSALLCLHVFLTANAAEDVSPSDLYEQIIQQPENALQQPEDVLQQTENTLQQPEQTEPVIVRTVTATRESADFVLSNQTGRKRDVRSRFKKFLPSASYNGNYRSELNDTEKEIYDGWIDNFVTRRNPVTQPFTVEVTPVVFDAPNCVPNPDDPDKDYLDNGDIAFIDDMVLSASAAFFYDRADVFWVRAFSYTLYVDLSTDTTSGAVTGSFVKVVFSFERGSYPNAYNDIAAFDAGITAAVNSITQSRKSQSAYETVKAIHDYIIVNASYEYDALRGDTYTYGYAYTATPLFTGKGKFVCEGYSKAMKILCDEFGINCALVSGEGMTSESSGGPHMWNYVQIDGKWYGVDSTWDDGYAYQDGTPCPMYNYFLVGSTTCVRNNMTFAQDHINDGAVMQDWDGRLVFPTLSESAYDHYIVDTDPKIHLNTLGASIRISDPYGIRYGIQIVNDDGLKSVHYIPEFGTLIIASGTLGDNELTINTPKVRKIRADNIFSQDETQYVYTGVLINIPRSFFGTKVKGRGYLIYIDNATGEEHIIYSQTVERSFLGVAQAAYDSYSAIENPDDSQRAIIEKLRSFLN